MSEIKHAKLPWRAGKHPYRDDKIHVDNPSEAFPETVAMVYGNSREAVKERVDLIVTAVNNHHGLLEACLAHEVAEGHRDNCEDCDDEHLCEEGCVLYSEAIKLRKLALANAGGVLADE